MISGIIYERIIVSIEKIFFYNIIEFDSPWIGFCMHGEQHEVMHEVPAAQNQDSLLSQWTEFFTHPEQEGQRLVVIQAELYYRYICSGVHMPENRPGPMAESPFVIESEAGAAHVVLHQLCPFPRSRGGIFNPVEFRGEPVEIMDLHWIIC